MVHDLPNCLISKLNLDVRIISNNIDAVDAFFSQSKGFFQAFRNSIEITRLFLACNFQSLVANGPDDILIMHDMKYWSMR